MRTGPGVDFTQVQVNWKPWTLDELDSKYSSIWLQILFGSGRSTVETRDLEIFFNNSIPTAPTKPHNSQGHQRHLDATCGLISIAGVMKLSLLPVFLGFVMSSVIHAKVDNPRVAVDSYLRWHPARPFRSQPQVRLRFFVFLRSHRSISGRFDLGKSSKR